MSPEPGRVPPANEAGGGKAFIAALLVSGLAALAFHLVSARTLSAGDYAELAVFAGVIATLAVPLGSAQSSTARQVAAAPGAAIGPALRTATFIGLGVAAVISLFAYQVAALLGSANPIPVLWLGAWIAANLFQAVTKGALLGAFDHRNVSRGLVLGAVARIAFAIPMTAKWGVSGAMAATALGELANAPLFLWALRGRCGTKSPGALRLAAGQAARIAVAESGLWALGTAALIVSGHVLGAPAAASFALAATLAGGALFLPSGRTIAAFPAFCTTGHAEAFRALARWCVGFGAFAAVAATVGGPTAVPILFGGDYRPSYLVFAALSVAYAPVGVATVGVAYLIARRSVLAGAGWVAVAAFIPLGFAAPSQVWLAAIFAAVAVAVAAFVLVASTRLAEATAPSAVAHPIPQLSL